jgi:hypothetical protein
MKSRKKNGLKLEAKRRVWAWKKQFNFVVFPLFQIKLHANNEQVEKQ